MEIIFKMKRNLYVVLITVVNFLLAVTPLNKLRLIILFFVGVRFGRHVVVERNVKIDFPWRLKIGDNCYISSGVYLDCRGGVINIGDDSDISQGAIIFTLSHDIQSKDFAPKCGDVIVGCRSWVCARSIILPGTTLGIGNVLGANSVFSGSAPDFSLIIGVPARVVKMLSNQRATHVRKL